MALPFVSSKNNYFQQDYNKLILNWSIVTSYLITQGYSMEEISIYKVAYFFFIEHPLSFDGATMTEDLCDVFNLDLDAMLHDFFYVKFSVSASYYYTQIADILFFKETLRKGKSSWNAGFRRFLLKLKSFLGYSLYARYVLKREMTPEQTTEFKRCVDILSK